ncbi:MAG: sugar phosphate isomerase/epimerase family protein [Thermoguttaceae bacterium]|jgi:sugar phosphate isomerase/epimerase
MTRPVTLVTGQWTDLPLAELAPKAAAWGYDGLELVCRSGYIDVAQAAVSKDYCQERLGILKENGLRVFAISNHAAGHLVCDLNDDSRTDVLAPPDCAGNAERKRQWAIEAMKNTARAARNLGVDVVTGFTGSSIWHLLYRFPPVPEAWIEEGFAQFARLWNPILDVFDTCGVRFALEVHPAQIAFDLVTARRALEAIGHRPAFGFNFDPSHLLWQMIDPVRFLHEFSDRIYHVHVKDVALRFDGATGILGSHLRFGDPRRAWDFRSPGHGDVKFEEIFRTLNQIGYQGPLSVEWEDSGMNRLQGAREACEFVKRLDTSPSTTMFDAAFDRH